MGVGRSGTRIRYISDIFSYMARNFMPGGGDSGPYETMLKMALRAYDMRAAYRISAMERRRRTVSLVGKFAIALNDLYNEVAFRPEHSGAKRAREEFEALAHEHDMKRQRAE